MDSKKDRTNHGFWRKKFLEFCNRTDLHGYKYIVMKELHVGERIFWACAVLMSTAFAGYFVITAYKWYARNPIITVIESTHGAIWDVPFPAVTICDINHISLKRARNFADSILLPNNVTAEDIFAALKFAPLLHSRVSLTEDRKQMLYRLQETIDLNKLGIEDFYKKVAPVSCNHLIQRCMWKNTVYRCELLFQRILSSHTLCCSFNYYAVDPVSTSSVNQLLRPNTPRRVSSCGYQTALSVLVNIETEDYYSSSVSSYGVMVYVDNAYNFPNLNSPMQMINPHSEVFIALAPERTYATDGVARFDIDVRQCLYAKEVKIAKFKEYSYHNCMAYRSVMKTLRACGCTPYYFPTSDSNRTCNFRDLDCIQKLKQSFDFHTNIDSEIQCMPDCEHYDYPLEVAMGLLVKETPINNLIFFKDIVMKNHSLLNVFFNDLVSTRYRRDVYLNWQNLLSSFGGLMSLMLGFTVISGFDLVIFFTFRIAYDAYKAIVKYKIKRNIKDENQVEIFKHTYDREANGDKLEQIIRRKRQNKQWNDPPRYEDTARY